ncbi:LacI family DNA-binding transcriptional regulator [Microbacterium sp. AGC62]
MAKVTLRDVADHAGVATSTVSRALTMPDRIAAETRARVMRSADELGYVPLSRSGRSRRGVVALLVPDVTNPFYFDIIRGTQTQLQAAGYLQLLVDTGESPHVESDNIERLLPMVDGIILTATRLDTDTLLGFAERIPIVAVNRGSDDVPGALLDTRVGLKQALDHLRSLNHTQIAFAAGPIASWQNAWRGRELEALAKERDMRLRVLGPYPPQLSSGAVAADALLVTEATACIAFNDLLAIGMLQRLEQRGVSVPSQMSVIGCDDIFGASFCSPPLTTISGNAEQAGRIATGKLVSRLNGNAPNGGPPVTALSTHLLVRDSSGPALLRGGA